MIIKKYQAETETEAIVLAREELGKEAIVMNIKKIRPRGLYRLFKKPVVEITAAVDDNVSYNQNEEALKQIRELGKKAEQARIPDPSIHEQKEATAIEERLNELQSMLEQQMNRQTEDKKESSTAEEAAVKEEEEPGVSCIQLIYNQLIGSEMDEKYANQLVGEIEKSLGRDASVDNILASVYQKLVLKLGQPETIGIQQNRTKYIFFIGPTGVGKTTTIAKVASRFKLEQNARIALVTADTYRIAAVEQLKTYASILGIPIKVVYTPEELLDLKGELTEFDLVFVDTAGRSHKNREQRDDIEKLISCIPKEKREVYLVLSATTKYNDLIRIAQTYKEITDYSLIFTKLDETSCIGNIYNIRMLTGAPLSYATCGQNVPDDINVIDTQDIAKQLLGGSE